VPVRTVSPLKVLSMNELAIPGGPRIAPLSMLDNHWRQWIAENLMLGVTAESLVPSLIAQGLGAMDASNEIAMAANSPYLQGSQRLINRLKKREWLLECYSRLHGMLPLRHLVEVRHKLSRDEFLRDYYTANRPVVITGMMEDWPALRTWTPTTLRERFGARDVEIQLGRTKNQRYESEANKHKKTMPFSEYIDMVVTGGATNDYYMTANNSSSNFTVLKVLWDEIVQIPEYLDGNSSQKGFFWFGPKGTITPLHHDLTNNFMAQVYGRKLVKLVPACDLHLVSNDHHCFSQVDAGNIDPQQFPEFPSHHVIDCEIGPGEILFLPIGWWHYVVGLEISMTMSFTNFVFDNDFFSTYKTYQAC
jgi:hypothetical protein